MLQTYDCYNRLRGEMIHWYN